MQLAVVSRIESRLNLSAMEDEENKQRRVRHYRTLAQCLARNFGKGFFIGASGMTIVYAFRALIGVLRGRILSLSSVFNRYSTEWGMYVGGVLALFNGTMYLTSRDDDEAAASDHEEEKADDDSSTVSPTRSWLSDKAYYYRGCLAGAAAGFAMMIGPQDRESKKTVALFLFARALEMQAQIWHKNGWFPKMVSDFEHWDCVLMSASSAQVLWAWIFMPNLNDPTYQFFLDRHGQKPRPVIDSIQAMCRNRPLPISALNDIRRQKKLPLLPNDPFLVVKDPSMRAAVMHPLFKGGGLITELQHSLKYWWDGFLLAYPLYTTVFTTSTLIFSHKRLLKAPWPTFVFWASNIVQASCFLTTYCTVAFSSIPVSWYFGIRSEIMAVLAGLAAGGATLVERKSRRIELALYVFQHALRSFTAMARNWGWTRALMGFDRSYYSHIFFSVISFVTWGHCFVRHPDCMRSAYLSSATYLLDSDEKHSSVDFTGYTASPRVRKAQAQEE